MDGQPLLKFQLNSNMLIAPGCVAHTACHKTLLVTKNYSGALEQFLLGAGSGWGKLKNFLTFEMFFL